MKHGYFFICGPIAALAACSQPSSVNPRQQTTTATVDLLAQGSPKACSADDVRSTLYSMAKPDLEPNYLYNDDDVRVGEASLTYNLDLITLASVDKSVSSVTCDANLTLENKGKGSRSFSIRYQIRPSVEDETTFIISSDITGEPKQFATQIATLNAIVASGDRQSAERANNQPAQVDVTNGSPEDSTDQPAPTQLMAETQTAAGNGSDQLVPAKPPSVQIETVAPPPPVISLTPTADND